MFPLVHALRAEPDIQVRICVTAQHRDMLDQVLAIAQITPDHDLDVMQVGQSLDALTARLIMTIGEVLDAEQPDRVLVQGDTATTMAAALAAYYRKIPVGHVEAGLRSGDIYQPWPEEVNRKTVSSIADLHFAPTQRAADALIAENVQEERIHVTGNTVIDALFATKTRIAEAPALAAGLDGLAARFAGKRLIAVTAHRRENAGIGMMNIAAAIGDIAARDDVAVIVPVHPNPDVRRAMEELLGERDNVALINPLDYPHFVRLLSMSNVILTDSGGVQEEAPALGKPVLVMRDVTERPEGLAAGTAKLVGTQRSQIVAETFRLLDDKTAFFAMAQAHNPYGDGRAAQKIAQIIARVHGAA